MQENKQRRVYERVWMEGIRVRIIYLCYNLKIIKNTLKEILGLVIKCLLCIWIILFSFYLWVCVSVYLCVTVCVCEVYCAVTSVWIHVPVDTWKPEYHSLPCSFEAGSLIQPGAWLALIRLPQSFCLHIPGDSQLFPRVLKIQTHSLICP